MTGQGQRGKPAETFGEALRRALGRRSRKKVAAQTGLPEERLAAFEADVATPSLSEWASLREAFDQAARNRLAAKLLPLVQAQQRQRSPAPRPPRVEPGGPPPIPPRRTLH